jgi:hypothetical protein
VIEFMHRWTQLHFASEFPLSGDGGSINSEELIIKHNTENPHLRKLDLLPITKLEHYQRWPASVEDKIAACFLNPLVVSYCVGAISKRRSVFSTSKQIKK